MIAQGAESKVWLKGEVIIKERVKKGYRIREIDEPLRKTRTRRESKNLQKAHKIINTPKVLRTTNYTIEMEHIKGAVLRDVINNTSEEVIKKIGKMIALLHKNNIIHGDLTTSNIIIKNNEPYLIDFGLSEVKESIEARAVDLHLLKQALESKHHAIAQKTWRLIKKEYEKNYNKSSEVMKRLIIVEHRGRYKHRN